MRFRERREQPPVTWMEEQPRTEGTDHAPREVHGEEVRMGIGFRVAFTDDDRRAVVEGSTLIDRK